jgi:hypothetical protein
MLPALFQSSPSHQHLFEVTRQHNIAERQCLRERFGADILAGIKMCFAPELTNPAILFRSSQWGFCPMARNGSDGFNLCRIR